MKKYDPKDIQWVDDGTIEGEDCPLQETVHDHEKKEDIWGEFLDWMEKRVRPHTRYSGFSDQANIVMELARREANRLNHEYISTGHILLGMIRENNSDVAKLLNNLDVDLDQARLQMEDLVKIGPEKNVVEKYPLTPRAKNIIEIAFEEARKLNHDQVSSEHLLLGLLKDPDGVASQILDNLGLKSEIVYEKVMNIFD